MNNGCVFCYEWEKQAEADRINIHNKLNEPERQPHETTSQYRERIKSAALKKGYGPEDYVVMW